MLTPRNIQIAVTRSGAFYAHCGGVLLRLRGYEMNAYNLESGLAPFEVGGRVEALVLPPNGVGVSRVASTRIVEVHRATTRDLGFILDHQLAAIARAAAALDLIPALVVGAPV